MGRDLHAVNDIRVKEYFSGAEFGLLLDHLEAKGLLDMQTPPPRPLPPRRSECPVEFPPGAQITQDARLVTPDGLLPFAREFAIAGNWHSLDGLEDTARGLFFERWTLAERVWPGIPGKIAAGKFDYPGEAWWVEPDDCLIIAAALVDIPPAQDGNPTFGAEWAVYAREHYPSEFRRFAELNGFLIT